MDNNFGTSARMARGEVRSANLSEITREQAYAISDVVGGAWDEFHAKEQADVE